MLVMDVMSDYEVSWGIQTGSFIQYRSISGSEDEIAPLAEKLAETPDVIGVTVRHKEAKTNSDISDRDHYHMVNGVEQNHNWRECPENPVNFIE